MPIVAKLDELGRGAWIALMVLAISLGKLFSLVILIAGWPIALGGVLGMARLLSGPFQFPMHRMFYATAFFCVAAWAFSALLKYGPENDDGRVLFFSGCAAIGAGLGAIIGRPIRGALWGFGVPVLGELLFFH